MLQEHVNELKQQNKLISQRCEENEQYGRRLCLCIEGIELKEDEKAEDVFEAVHEMMKKEVPDIPSAVLDRAHRIGKVRSVDGKNCQSTIVKFFSFRHRTILYRKRKDIKDLSIRLDLTKARYNLLKVARQKTDDNDGVDYVYADVNCRLKVHLASGQDKVFSSLDDLNFIIRESLALK